MVLPIGIMLKQMDMGPYPVQLHLCVETTAWKRFMKKIGYEETPEPVEPGSVTTFGWPDPDSVAMVMYFSDEFLRRTEIERLGIISHEVTHVWQNICLYINETKPGTEVEAYSIQWIYAWVYEQLYLEGWIR